jgi:hypothetical protein
MILSSELDQVICVMRSFSFPWFIAGGWALDLAFGKQTRTHEDVDVCCFRENADDLLQFFSNWDRRVAVPEENRFVEIQTVDDLSSPRHELHFQKKSQSIEVLLIDKKEKEVIFRRDTSILLSVETFSQVDSCGRPYVVPSWQLLFKAKNPRPKDQADFLMHAPKLNKKERQWLLSALQLHQPSGTWISYLEEILAENNG